VLRRIRWSHNPRTAPAPRAGVDAGAAPRRLRPCRADLGMLELFFHDHTRRSSRCFGARRRQQSASSTWQTNYSMVARKPSKRPGAVVAFKGMGPARGLALAFAAVACGHQHPRPDGEEPVVDVFGGVDIHMGSQVPTNACLLVVSFDQSTSKV